MARPNRISRYLTEIQRIYIIGKLKQGFSYRQIAQEFKQKFKRKISIGTISKLKEKGEIFGKVENQNSSK